MTARNIALVFVCSLLATPAFGQSDRGTIVGIVTDPDGGVIPGVTVTALSPDTGQTYVTVTTGTGNYTILQLPVGVYNVVIQLQGFMPFRQDGVRVFVAQAARIDAKLRLGGVTSEVTVTGEASLLDTQSGSIASSITVENLNQLPLNFGARGNFAAAAIRNPYTFVNLVPGGSISNYSSLKLNGAPLNTFQIRVEGMEANNQRLLIRIDQVQPSVESLEEMTVHTSNFAAEYGQVAGGIFNLTAKSGTNRLTGSAFEYFVHEVFSSGIPFTDDGTGKRLVPRNRRNNFGFSVGGPLTLPRIYNGRSKTFFFFTLEQFRQRETRAGLLATMPTDAMRTGNFSEALTNRQLGTDPLGRPIMENTIYDPRTTRTVNGLVVRDPFPGNVIPSELLSPVALKIQTLIPKATRPGVINNWDQAFPADTTKSIATLKMDHNFARVGGKLSAYYSRYWGPHFNGSDGLPEPITAVRRIATSTHTMRFSYDWTLTPTTLLNARVGYVRHDNPDFGLPSVMNFDPIGQLGLRGAYNGIGFPEIGAMSTATGGGMSQSMSRSGSATLTKKPQFLVNVTHARNSHTYKAGFEWRNDRYADIRVNGTHGSYSFAAAQTGLPSTQQQPLTGGAVGLAYASFLMGLGNTGSITNPADPQWIKPAASVFAQDTWRIRNNLTLDYGVRWDYQGFPSERRGFRSQFDPNTPNPSVGNRLGAMMFEGSGAGTCNCAFVETYPYAFAPRVGASWSITPKTVLRGGWALTYGQTADGQANGGGVLGVGGWKTFNFQSAAFGEAGVLLNNGLVYDKAALDVVEYNVGLRPTTGQTDSPGAMLHPDAGKPPRLYQWSLSLQRELTRNLMVDVAYVGNRGSGFSSNQYQNLNVLTYERLAQLGLDPIANAADRTLLRAQVGSATAISRGFGTVPYPGFATTNTVAQSLRPFPQFGTAGLITEVPEGRTKYHSLQIKGTQRLNNGLSFTATFTAQYERTNRESASNPFLGPDDPLNWSIPNNSEPLVTVFAFNYEIPAMGNRVTRAVFGGWTVGGILRYASGAPIAVPNSNTNLAQLLFLGTRMNRVEGEPLFLKDLNGDLDPKKDFVLNPKAWADPAQGEFATSPAYYDDFRFKRRPDEQFSVGRVFRLGDDRKTLSVRAEFFNALNRVDLNNPTLGNPTATQLVDANGNTVSGFGRIDTGSTFGPPRSGQLVARIGW